MSALATATRRLALRRPRLRVSRRHARLAIAAALALALIIPGGWFLLRDSSLVAVDHITVTGADGADGAAIRAALEHAARKMTTLDIQAARLRAAVAGFPEVKGVQVSTRFPHGIVVHVIELAPVALAKVAGREVPVTADGTLLPKVAVTGSLPLIPLTEPPLGRRLEQPWAAGAVRLLGAAPRRLLGRLAEAMTVAGHGLVVQVRSGPSIYFGDDSQLQAKWAAVLAVLADSSSAGAAYIDVTDPEHPAAGTDSTLGAGASAGSAPLGGSGTSASTASGSSSPGTGTTAPATGASTSPATGASTSPATGATASPGTATTPAVVSQTAAGASTGAATSGG